MNIKGRHFLKLLDFTPEEINGLVELAARLKADKKAGVEKQMLKGKNIVLLFEKDSTRTRCAFEVGAHDQGAHVTYLGPTGSQMGKKESIADTARVLGRMYDGIEYRGYGQNLVEELAKYAGVVVWNGLPTEFHPTQDPSALPPGGAADVMTGVELRRDGELLFRGGMLRGSGTVFLYNTDGGLADLGLSIAFDGVLTYAAGKESYGIAPSAATLIDLGTRPAPTRKGL